MTVNGAADTAHPPVADGYGLEVQRLSKSFGGLHVLEEVSIGVPRGMIYGVAGPNGAGKTTLLNIVSGFDRADGGTIAVNGTDSTRMKARQLSHKGVARTFQNIRLFRGMTVREQVSSGGYRHRKASMVGSMFGLPADRADKSRLVERADELLEFVGLADVGDRLAETLSYGDQRRIEVARALATEPSLLLLDEPTAGMNDADWMPIADLLGKVRDQGTTVVVIEHNMRLLERICARIAVLNAGAVIAEDEPGTCLRLPDVRRAYFGK